ncbi:MAG: MCE family protein [candidate division NC10 bacterium]|nr:MCE family protein [candidate division NC10 bacterium]
MRLSAEARVGLFVFLGIMLLAALTLRVGGFGPLKKGGTRIQVIFESVEGLDEKAPVRLAGVRVGEVERIEVKGAKAVVTLRLNPGVEVYRNYRVRIASLGLLGEKYVEITPVGEEKSEIIGRGELVREGSPPLKGEAPVGVDKFLTQLSDLAEDVKKLSSSLVELVGTPEARRTIKNILSNAEALTGNLNRAVVANRENLDRILANLRTFSGDLSSTMKENKDSVSNLIKNLEKLSQDLSGKSGEIAENIKVITQNLKDMLSENRENVAESIKNIKEASAKVQTTIESLNKITSKIEKGEGTLGKLVTDEELAKDLKATARGLKEAMTGFDRFKFYIGYRGEYLARPSDSRNVISLRIQPREDKYYLFEVVDDPMGTVKRRETTTTTTVDGRTTTETEKKTEVSNKLGFTALIAKRFYDLTLKGGLIQSTGGVGAEYTFLDDRLNLGLEVFDFHRSGEPRLRASAKYNLLKSLFIQGGVDYLLQDDQRTFYLGGGFLFEDEDLKLLLGRAPVSIGGR